MRHGMIWRLLVVAVATATAATLGISSASAGPAHTSAKTTARAPAKTPAAIDKSEACSDGPIMCAEVADYQNTFHYYVGHDEPSVLFYSDKPGAGNRMRYQLTLPRDPGPDVVPGRSWSFQLTPAF